MGYWDEALGVLGSGEGLPIVSIIVPFSGLPYRILHIPLVKPKEGATMEAIGKP